MLKIFTKLMNYKILAKDSGHTFGRVKDLYFDDEKWAVRYLVLDTGSWLSESLTLVSPYNVIEVDWDREIVWINLTRKQIENGPKAELNKPPTRFYEAQYNSYYGLPNYWGTGFGPEIDGLWAGSYYPHIPEKLQIYNDLINNESEKDLHLRSMNEVLGYHVEAVGDEDFGAVTDFIFEEATWGLRYIIIDTHKFWPGGKKILFSPTWVQRFDWIGKKMVTYFHRKVIESCPEYNPDLPLDYLDEESLFSHFTRGGDQSLENMDHSSHHPK